MVVVSLCRPGPAWRTPTNSKLFPFRRAVVSLCWLRPAWRTPTNNKFFPFRMAVVSLCRLGAAGGHRRTANFTHFVWLWLACATLEHRKEHRRSTNFFHPVGLYNKKASCDPKNREATRKPFLSNQCNFFPRRSATNRPMQRQPIPVYQQLIANAIRSTTPLNYCRKSIPQFSSASVISF